MREYLENNAYVQEFDSVDDIIKFAGIKSRPNNSYPPTRGEDWYGEDNRTYHDVIKHTKGTWKPGIRRLAEIEAINSIGVLSRKRIRSRGDFGNEVDIHRVYSGQVDTAWSTTPKVEAKRTRPITVAVPIGDNCYVKADILFWRGAAGIKLVEALNFHNIPTRLYGYFCTRGSFVDTVYKDENIDNKYKCIVLIKDHQHPLNLEVAIKVCAMSGFFRYYGFKSILNNKYFDTVSSLGHIDNAHPPLFNGDKVFITPTNINNKKDAEKWINKVIGKVLLDERVEEML